MFEDKRSEPLPTEVTEEDRADAVEDEYGAKYSRDGLKLLSLPKNIERYEIREGTRVICDRAFEMCRSLRKIAIPASVTGIGRYAFAGCESLRKVIIPASVTGIWDYAFAGCESLRKMVIPASVTGIGDSAFRWCSSLREVVISASVTGIGRYAFSGCRSLRKAVIPDSVTGIGDGAFSWCRSLREIAFPSRGIFPSSVKNIGEYAFLGCSSLASIIVPQGQARNFLELLKRSGCDLSAIREQGGLEAHLKFMQLVDSYVEEDEEAVREQRGRPSDL